MSEDAVRERREGDLKALENKPQIAFEKVTVADLPEGAQPRLEHGQAEARWEDGANMAEFHADGRVEE